MNERHVLLAIYIIWTYNRITFSLIYHGMIKIISIETEIIIRNVLYLPMEYKNITTLWCPIVQIIGMCPLYMQCKFNFVFNKSMNKNWTKDD